MLGKRPTKVYEETVNGGRYSALSMPGITHLEGGVPIVVAGECLGAVGISGDTGDNDELCALAGLAAAGLRAAPGKITEVD